MPDDSSPDAATERAQFLSWITLLVHQHRARLVTSARRRGLPPEDALDCVQDAFVTFLRMPEATTLSARSSEVERLLSTLVAHAALNQRRKLARRALPTEIELSEVASDLPSADTLVAEAEARVSLVRCVQQLSQMQQAVIRLRLLDECPGEEVSTLLEISPENARILLFRARQRLRECLVLAMKDPGPPDMAAAETAPRSLQDSASDQRLRQS
ncbi:sigma-70 family RNA polymerase sigma factor [Corallococcus exiguus]|uniref:Sigma-70 family RNA polymerase sigma factor n=1 Tax=Corallococcus exiguus TaxID=83462 RepID=A0A7Y1X0G2_9BACT|nr:MULTISPECIES: sigma-70 family RNA polymerase sigma factor [Corallococcus]NBC46237.1 sigma-70 family RNA polymerase sigma factor [Corallococcus exiguus]NNC20640.1 sigma-70 family RNA polymerase sigma factor [Corallococcus exiguus]NRD52944.1 sigma-70 family RNA polymerase sigma factor [Corallococcus exiguus]RKH25981.1 sigma-70 family RNA polymerase sigma factor [Corallococcus sp. CA041A]TNV54207.1 sigma-70 family RNA polymerase sigma factor [Corallococcus exiguus]